MKGFLLSFVISLIAFTTATFFVPGLNYHGDLSILLKAALAFALLNILLRPIIKLLLMPLNFLTMGFLSGISGLVLLWLLTVLIPGFNLTDSSFPGLNLFGLLIPGYRLSTLFTAVLGASLISLISSSLYWLTK